ncbi:MAG: ester cyclase [Deltaproteobacteria bacterium]|nr:ester cyclase [Deltaproteobacteria bacterium]
MSIQENKNIARRFIQVWGDGDLDIIEELAAPSLLVQYPIMPKIVQGSKTFRKVMESFRSAFPDSDLKIEEEIAEGDKVAIRWSFSGTHQGILLNFPATGTRVKWTGITIYRIADGKIMEEKGEEDFLGFLRQIGSVP